MNNKNFGKLKRPSVLLTMLLVFVFLFSFSQTVHAQLTQGQINAILGLLESFGAEQAVIDNVELALTGQPVTPPPTVPVVDLFTRDLFVGVTGPDVRRLQQWLNGANYTVATTGAGSPGNETEYFGERTRSAVAAYQVANNISPTAGYFGPLTRASVNARIEAAVPPPPPPPPPPPVNDEPVNDEPPLAGNEGDIVVTDLSVSNVNLGLGTTDVVYELEIEALDSDVAINRVDFHFTQALRDGTAGVARPWLYFSEVVLRIDGEEVGVLSGSGDFTEITRPGTNHYRARFSGLNEIIREGDVVEMTLEVAVRSAMTGDRENDTVTVQMLNDAIRFVDGAGLTHFGPAAQGEVDMTFDEEAAGSLRIMISDDSPDATHIIVDEDARTDNVELLVFDVEARNQNVTIDDVDVVLTTSNSNLNNMLRRVRLYADGSLLSTKTLPSATTGTITFDGLRYEIARNSEVEFSVRADFYETDRTGFDVPDTIEIELDRIRGIDEDFRNVVEEDIGVGAGIEHGVIDVGLTAEIVSRSQTSEADGEVGKYTFVIDLTAHGDTFRFAEGAVSATASGPGTAQMGAPLIVSSTATPVTVGGVEGYRIGSGQTRQITVEVFINDVTTTGQYRVTLEELEYGTTTFTGAASSPLQLGAPDFRSGLLTILQ